MNGGMRNTMKIWNEIKNRGENIGLIFVIYGICVLLIQFVLVLVGLRTEIDLLSISLGLLSFGLGCIAIGISTKATKRQTDLLERLDKNVERLPLMLKNDILTPSGQILAEEMRGEQSKKAAQKRLDDDTKRVGYLRGELYQLKDGTWAISWGGKYPL